MQKSQGKKQAENVNQSPKMLIFTPQTKMKTLYPKSPLNQPNPVQRAKEYI